MRRFLARLSVLGVMLGVWGTTSWLYATEPKRIESPEVSRRVIMMQVGVTGSPAPGDDTDEFEIRLYTADAAAVPVVPVGLDIVYGLRKDQGPRTGANADRLEVTIPVTLIGAPRPGRTGYLREIQVSFVVGDQASPRIPTGVRVVYASGEKPLPVNLGSGVAGRDSDPVPASTCTWQNVDGVNHCVGTCVTGVCAMYTVEKDGHQVTKCGCIIIVERPVEP